MPQYHKSHFCIFCKFLQINIHFSNFGFGKKHIEKCGYFRDKSLGFSGFSKSRQKETPRQGVLEILLVLP